MEKIHKLRCPKIIPAIITAITLISNPVLSLVSSTAYAAPAVVPVAGEALYALLVALGLIVGNEAGEYVWKGNGNPYVDSIFEEQVAGITSGIPISNEMLGELENTVIPENVYTTDGTDFYVSGNKITTSDLYLTAKSLAGVSYGMPVNISGAQHTLGFGINYNGRYYAYCDVPYSDFGSSYYFFPYFITPSGSIIQNYACQFIRSEKPITTMGYDFKEGIYFPFTADVNRYEKFLYFPCEYGGTYSTSSADNFGMSYPVNMPMINNSQVGVSYTTVSGTVNTDNWTTFFQSVTSCGLLRTTGLPVLELQGDKTKLESEIVKVEPPKDDDDDNKTPPVPQSPNNWDLWKSVEDLIRFIDTGEVSNGNTDFGQYVNNNYNYVQVDINVPDEISTNVNVGGTLGIDGKGDINITINDNTSLPSVSDGDGSGFYNPDAVDAIAALTTNNPAVQLIKGLFMAIDPVLVGVFSVGVSLLVVLGIWKLIRG